MSIQHPRRIVCQIPYPQGTIPLPLTIVVSFNFITDKTSRCVLSTPETYRSSNPIPARFYHYFHLQSWSRSISSPTRHNRVCPFNTRDVSFVKSHTRKVLSSTSTNNRGLVQFYHRMTERVCPSQHPRRIVCQIPYPISARYHHSTSTYNRGLVQFHHRIDRISVSSQHPRRIVRQIPHPQGIITNFH